MSTEHQFFLYQFFFCSPSSSSFSSRVKLNRKKERKKKNKTSNNEKKFKKRENNKTRIELFHIPAVKSIKKFFVALLHSYIHIFLLLFFYLHIPCMSESPPWTTTTIDYILYITNYREISFGHCDITIAKCHIKMNFFFCFIPSKPVGYFVKYHFNLRYYCCTETFSLSFFFFYFNFYYFYCDYFVLFYFIFLLNTTGMTNNESYEEICVQVKLTDERVSSVIQLKLFSSRTEKKKKTYRFRIIHLSKVSVLSFSFFFDFLFFNSS